ncbi:hypothetical protein VTN96DRAFT_9176 [Rasamsonia emersonii]
MPVCLPLAPQLRITAQPAESQSSSRQLYSPSAAAGAASLAVGTLDRRPPDASQQTFSSVSPGGDVGSSSTVSTSQLEYERCTVPCIALCGTANARDASTMLQPRSHVRRGHLRQRTD